jgi:hypothetical protein
MGASSNKKIPFVTINTRTAPKPIIRMCVTRSNLCGYVK